MDHKKELDAVSKEIIKLENLLQKQEEDGIYDDSLYKEIDKLETKRQELERLLESEEM